MKNFNQITITDVEDLIVRKERENLHLEYKETLGNSDRDKMEFLKDVSGFANSSGGYLIIGVDEKDGLPNQIVGIQPLVGAQKVDEWIDNVLISNVDDGIKYSVKIIPLQDKVVLILHISESPKKPHMVTFQNKNVFFMRHNTNVMAASQSEVKGMFEYSRRIRDLSEEFIQKRHLADEYDTQFGISVNSSLLRARVNNSEGKKPFCLFNFIPRYLNKEIVPTSKQDFRDWISANRTGFPPEPTTPILSCHKYQVGLDSITFPAIMEFEPYDFRNYIQFHQNGFFEAGLSYELFFDRSEAQSNPAVLSLTNIVGFTWLILGFAEHFYRHFNYLDEVVFQISLVGISGITLGGFGKKDSGSTWAEPFTFHYENPPSCKYHKNVRIEEGLIIADLNAGTIEAVARLTAERISNAFGEVIVKCFDDQGNFNLSAFNYFRH